METPIAFVLSTLMASAVIFIALRAALVPERFSRWTRFVTGSNGKWAFGGLLLLWVVAMAVLASLGLEANVVGGFALIGLLAGFFIFMGFIWAVIGE